MTEFTDTPSFAGQPRPSATVYAENPAGKTHTKIDDSIARSVYRHSLFVNILRWVLPLCCLGIISVFLYSSGILHQYFAPQVEEIKPIVAEDSVEMFQPRMSGLDRKKQTYSITAETAKQDIDDPSRMIMKNLTGSLKLNASDDEITLTAKSGFLNTETNFLQLREDIVVTSRRGYVAYLTTADVWLKKNQIISKNPVLIEWDDGSIHANAMKITNGGKVIRFFNHVKVKLKSNSGKKSAKEKVN